MCDPETTRNSRHLGKTAYGPRGDDKNPYCEGRCAQKVANAGRRVEVVDCVLGPRPSQIGEQVSWVFCWPFTDVHVEVHGRYGASNVFYRLDGEEPDQTPDQTKPDRDEFVWSTSLLAEAGYDAADMFVGACALVPDKQAESGLFGKLAPGTKVMLPTLRWVQGEKHPPAKPELTVSLLVQGEAIEVASVSLRRVGDPKGETIPLAPGRYSPRLNPDQHGWMRIALGGEGPVADGSVYRVDVAIKAPGPADGSGADSGEKVMFYLRVPTADFLEWATHGG